jgi:ParB/RepB/Spo0J family partition protein
MTKTETAVINEDVVDEGTTNDVIYFFALSIVHPDPEQPREVPDDELQASINAQGIIQAITVRPHPDLADEWMIVDGARRYAGASAAKLEEIPCRIRLDLEEVADRVIVQLTANTGKPLTALEQARALRKVLDASDPQITTAELARRTGMARSTVQDRLGLLNIPEPWLVLASEGELQSSHVPAIQPFKDLPEAAHKAVIEKLTTSYQWRQKGRRPLSVDQFNEVVRRSYEEQLFPIGRKDSLTSVTIDAKDYDGVVITYQRRFVYPADDKPKKYAADPSKWQPLFKKAEASQERERGDSNSPTAKPKASKGKLRITLPKDTEIVKAKTQHDAPPKDVVDTEAEAELVGEEELVEA